MEELKIFEKKWWLWPSVYKLAPTLSVALSDSRVSHPSQDAEEVLSGFLKIT